MSIKRRDLIRYFEERRIPKSLGNRCHWHFNAHKFIQKQHPRTAQDPFKVSDDMDERKQMGGEKRSYSI